MIVLQRRKCRSGNSHLNAIANSFRQSSLRISYVSSGLGGLATDDVLAEYIVMPEVSVIVIPEHLSFAEAACLPCAAVTAWNGLVVRAGLKAGDGLLILGTGGVALLVFSSP